MPEGWILHWAWPHSPKQRLRTSYIVADGTRRLGMSVPSSLKPRTLPPFGGVRGIGGRSGRESLVTLEQRIASSDTYVM